MPGTRMQDEGEGLAAPWRWFAGLFALALGLRVGAIDIWSMHHPDAIAQYLEQAYRLIHGRGVVPWDMRAGIRSWLPPVLVAGPIWLGERLAPEGTLYLYLPRLAAALASMAGVAAAWAIGARRSPLHAVAAMAAVALWYESVLFAGRLLTEPLAATAMLAAAALLVPEAGRRRCAVAGALLGFAFVLRFQYAPAIAVLAILAIPRRHGAWASAVAGGAVVTLLAGALDLAMGAAPFAWMFENFRHNIVLGRAAAVSADPASAYAAMLWRAWWPLFPLILLLALPAARRHPVLFWTATANLAAHLAIGHKEYRYIWLTAQFAILLAGLGSADWALRLRERWPGWRTGWLAGALIGGWALLSLAAAQPVEPWGARYRAQQQLARIAGQRAEICGLALHETQYWASGYAHVRRALPLYFPWPSATERGDAAFARGVRGWNAAIAPAASAAPARAGFRPTLCRGEGPERMCLWQRPGGCDPRAAPDLEVQRVLIREDG